MSTNLIPFLDLHACIAEIGDEIQNAIASVVSGCQYCLGTEVEAFEKEWADFCQADYAIGVGNGLDALIIALRALDVGPGDEVIVPAHTFIATWFAVNAVGAQVVPIDVDAKTYNIDVAKIERHITERTRVIMPVHLYGQPANLTPIIQLAKRYSLFIIDDAAQAHGACYMGKKIGSYCDMTCWSFYPGKNLGALGDAGAITTSNPDLYGRVKSIRNYGSTIKYIHDRLGLNSRMDALQAAVLRVKLRRLSDWNAARKEIATLYTQYIQAPNIIKPFVPKWADPVWHLFVIRSPMRDRLMSYLEAHGVTTIIHYPVPPYRQNAYLSIFKENQFNRTDEICDEILSLPLWPQMKPDHVKRIATLLSDFTTSQNFA